MSVRRWLEFLHHLEAKLAETTSKRPLAVTIGAAIATIVVVLLILFGPTALSCSGSPKGFSFCFNQKLVSLGLSSPEAVAIATPAPLATPAPAETPAPEAQTAAPDAPTADTAKPAEPVAQGLIEATFGLLRAERDGSLVIAGSAAPGAEVEVFANGEPIGSAVTEASGDWVVVPERPLPAGGVEITLADKASGKVADKSFVVVIDPAKNAEPLVVASVPGQASAVLQGIASKAAGTAVAAAPDATPPETTSAEAAETTPDAGTTVVAAAPEVEAAPTEAPAAAAPASTAAAAPAETPVAVASAEIPAPPAAAADIAAVPPGDLTTAPTAPAPVAVASAPADQPARADVADVPVNIDAIEIDGDHTFFAGNGTEGATVRLYVDNTFIADAVVEGGRWLVEAGSVLGKAEQRVRVDMLRAGVAEVASRAEVNFKVDLPALPESDAAPTAVASAPEAAPAASDTTPSSAEPVTPAVVAATPAVPAAEAPAEAPAATAPEAAAVAVAEIPPLPQAATEIAQTPPADLTAAPPSAPASAPAADTPAASSEAPAQPAADQVVPKTQKATPAPSAPETPAPAAAPEAPAAEPAVPAATPPAAPATEPTKVPAPPAAASAVAAAPPAEVAAPEAPAVAEAAEAPKADAEEAVPTMVATAVGDADSQRFASGKAIIRRGDNLWTIARRVYGHGIKYTAIFEANTDQIRNPNRIYPGQVFDLPKTAE